MPGTISIRILISTLALSFAFATPVLAATQLFLGFMDDEVNGVLARTLKNNPRATVIAISAGELKDQLFGRPLRSYPPMIPGTPPTLYRTDIQPGSTTSVNPTTSIGARLSLQLRALTQNRSFEEQLKREYSNEAPLRTGVSGTFDSTLSLLEFRPQNPSSDLIIIIKSPEMGRQPNLVKNYMEPILRSIQTLTETAPRNGGMSLSVFGTSGGINPAYKPGTLTPVEASVYVGVEIDPDPQTPLRNRGVVSWVGKGQSKAIKYFDQPFATREEAERAARLAFVAPEFNRRRPIDAVLASGPTFLEQIESAKQSQHPASLTTSFFAGPDVKERSNTLGMVTVDMEDSQMLELAQRMGIPLEIKRLITDPAHIPKAAREAIAKWSRSDEYSILDYYEAILWGLRGGHLEDMGTHPALRKSATWTLFNSPEMSPYRELVSSIEINGERVILDPIFVEIASEFIKDAAKGELLTTTHQEKHSYEGIIYKNILDALDPPTLEVLNQLMDQKNKRVAEIAKKLLNDSARGVPEAELKPLVEQLLSKCMGLEIPLNTPLHRSISQTLSDELRLANTPSEISKAQAKKDLFEKLGRIRLLATDDSDQGTKPSEYHFSKWVVQTRWAGNTGRKLHYLGQDGMDPAAQDRLLYRSGLVSLTGPTILRFVDEKMRQFSSRQSVRLLAPKSDCATAAGRVGFELPPL